MPEYSGIFFEKKQYRCIYKSVLVFIKNQPGVMVVTANEMAPIVPYQYTLKFRHDFTNQEVILNDIRDYSKYPQRYNQFHIDTSIFNGFDNGFYTYSIFDHELNLLEKGKMKLIEPQSSPTQYNHNPTEYNTYGQ